jgi:hypothetical protein
MNVNYLYKLAKFICHAIIYNRVCQMEHVVSLCGCMISLLHFFKNQTGIEHCF